MKRIVLFTVCTFVAVFAQNPEMSYNEDAFPSLGWDTLQRSIIYPEIARRTGVEGVMKVEVQLDSVGHVMDVIIEGNSIFSRDLESAIRHVYWQPTLHNYKVRSSKVYFNVQYKYQKSTPPFVDPKRRTFIVEPD